jgi:hypothetical protein
VIVDRAIFRGSLIVRASNKRNLRLHLKPIDAAMICFGFSSLRKNLVEARSSDDRSWSSDARSARSPKSKFADCSPT